MSAVTALETRNTARHAAVNLRVPKSSRSKIVKLRLKPKTKRVQELTNRQRQELVIEFRDKARKLARSILRKWHSRLELEEVDSVVDLSLCEAVRRFNPAKGASFITFMYYHLKGNLIRAVSSAANANSIPLPDLDLGDGGWANTEARHNLSAINAIDVAEALCSQDHLQPDEVLYKKQMSALSQRACSNLEALERVVVERVFMDGEQLMNVARSLGYSRCHISRVKKKALETLFHMLKNSAGVGTQCTRDYESSASEMLSMTAGMRRMVKRRKQGHPQLVTKRPKKLAA